MTIGKSSEDYLEAVYNSLQERGHARTKEIADDLGVKAPSVTEMFQKLQSQGLLTYRRYRGAALTKEGEKIAKSVKNSHEAIREFFEILQVSKKLADADACKVEHNLSAKTTTQLKKFVNFLKNCSKDEPDWIEYFRTYSKTEKFPEEREKAS